MHVACLRFGALNLVFWLAETSDAAPTTQPNGHENGLLTVTRSPRYLPVSLN